MRHTHKSEDYYQIHSVYYKDGKVNGYSKEGSNVGGDTIEEVKEDLKRMLDSLDKEVLEYKND